MRRFLLIALGLIVTVPVALGARSSGNDPFSPIGLGQKVAVVVCSYKGEKQKPTDISVDTWVRVLNDKVNAFYKAATGNKVSFSFFAPRSDPTCRFKETYDETKPDNPPGSSFDIENDPATVSREAGQAVLWADGGDQLWAANDLNRLLVIVDRPKRGRATLPPGGFFQTGSAGPKNITVSVVTMDQGEDRATQKHHNAYTAPDEKEGIVNDQDIALIVHELGHQLGLYDLYRETNDAKEYTEFWDQMSFDNLENFSAFSRYLTGWLPPSGYRIVNRGSTPPGGLDVTVAPPLAGGTEAILLPTNGSIVPPPPGVAYNPTFQGYLVEARGHTGLDAGRPATYETGAPSTLNKYCGTMGLPAEYGDGVLVSATQAGFLGLTPTIPLTVKRAGPRGLPATVCTDDHPSKIGSSVLGQAPFTVGGTFSDPDVGLRVKVLSKTADGSYKLRIFFDSPPPTPNLVANDVWLDSPSNGFGTF